MPDVPPAPTPGLRTNQSWIRLWISQAVALIGFYVFNVTVVLWVATDIAAGQTWAPAAVSGVLVCAAAPVIIVGPIAGVYADRWDCRRTMMATDLIRAGLTASLILLPVVAEGASAVMQLAWIYLVVTAVSVCAQFFMPARFGLVATIVAEPNQSRAMSLLQASANTGTVIGPPIGAPLLVAFGAQWAIAVHVVALTASFALIRSIRSPDTAAKPGGSPNFATEFKEGLRYFVRTPLLIVLVIASSVAMLGLGALNTLNVFFVEHNLLVNAGWLGALTASIGAGSAVGALLAAWVAARFGEERFFWIGLLTAGLLIVGYSRLTSLPIAIAGMVLVGIPLGAVNGVMGPLVLRTTPQNLLGRMASMMNPGLQLASLTGMAVTGILASTVLIGLDASVGPIRLGPYDTVFLACGLLMTGSGIWAMRRLTGVKHSPTHARRRRHKARSGLHRARHQSSDEPPAQDDVHDQRRE